MSSTIRTRLVATAALCLIPVSYAFMASPVALPRADSAAPPLPHPHFPKTLTCKIGKGQPTLTIQHITVTYNKKGAEKMSVGKAWHLGGASFETDMPLVVGGEKVEAGKYGLSARKTKGGWSLVLHKGRGFSLPGEDAIELKTTFEGKSAMFEHLNCDVQPGGDKKSTQLFLDVRFDKMLARVLIELPE